MYRLILFLALGFTGCSSSRMLLSSNQRFDLPGGICLSGVVQTDDERDLVVIAGFLVRQDSTVNVVVTLWDLETDSFRYLIDGGRLSGNDGHRLELRSSGAGYPWTFRIKNGALRADFFSSGDTPFRIRIKARNRIRDCFPAVEEHFYRTSFSDAVLHIRSFEKSRLHGDLQLTGISGILPMPETGQHFVMLLPEGRHNIMAAATLGKDWRPAASLTPDDSCAHWYKVTAVDTVRRLSYTTPSRIHLVGMGSKDSLVITVPGQVRPIPFHKYFLIQAYGLTGIEGTDENSSFHKSRVLPLITW